MNRLSRMIIVPPQATHPIRIIARRIRRPICRRVIDGLHKRYRRIVHIRRDALIRRLKRRYGSNQQLVIVSHARSLLTDGRTALRDDERRVLDRRDGEEEEIPRARVIHDLHLGDVARDDGFGESGPVGEVPRVSDIVDADPDPEEGVGRCPGCEGGCGDEVGGEFGGLVDEGEDGAFVGGDERGILYNCVSGAVYRALGS